MMKTAIDMNRRENLKNELRNEFPNLSDAELNSIDESFENFIESVSLKVNRDRQEVARVVEERLNYINSKAI
ncbi:MAG: hypothetical protein JNM57_14440 [Cyclobacteriaceae bacterium]|nr:hypothetical protein [Cyclobacteriaceae bacterium]